MWICSATEEQKSFFSSGTVTKSSGLTATSILILFLIKVSDHHNFYLKVWAEGKNNLGHICWGKTTSLPFSHICGAFRLFYFHPWSICISLLEVKKFGFQWSTPPRNWYSEFSIYMGIYISQSYNYEMAEGIFFEGIFF